MKYLMAALVFCFVVPSFAETYRAVSLYSSGALVTGRFLPFKVYNGSNQPQSVASAFAYGPCETIIDNNRPEVFHLYCTSKTEVDLIVRLKNGVLLSAKDIPIKKVSLIEPEIIIDDSESLGSRLFRDNCIACHRTEPIAKGQTANSLKQALGTSPMKESGLDRLLNGDAEKIKALVDYINEEL